MIKALFYMVALLSVGFKQHRESEQIIQAFPDGSEPRYLLRDRDGIYGEDLRERVKAIGCVSP